MRMMYSVGCVVKLDNPRAGEWMIDEIVKEEIHEMSQEDVQGGVSGGIEEAVEGVKETARKDKRPNIQSLASLKVLCHKVSPQESSMMRIYYQIPWSNTDREEPDIRAAQAATFKPKELVAHQILSNDPRASKFTPRLLGFGEFKQQESWAAVPGGFLVIVVWEIVPGLRLGDPGGPSGFWSIQTPEEQKLIRECSKKTLLCVLSTLPTTGLTL